MFILSVYFSYIYCISPQDEAVDRIIRKLSRTVSWKQQAVGTPPTKGGGVTVELIWTRAKSRRASVLFLPCGVCHALR